MKTIIQRIITVLLTGILYYVYIFYAKIFKDALKIEQYIFIIFYMIGVFFLVRLLVWWFWAIIDGGND